MIRLQPSVSLVLSAVLGVPGLESPYIIDNGGPLSRGSHATCRQQVRNIHQGHLNRGWAGIGYHYLVCHHGIVMTGRGMHRVGAHAGSGANSRYIGIQFMLGGNQTPTSAQLKGFRELRAWLRSRGVGSAVTGHRDFMATACPGAHLYARRKSGNWGTGGSIPAPPSGGTRSTKSIQEIINAAGYTPKLVVDGDYGPKTEAGVRWYQKKIGTTADGDWGPKTEAAHLAYIKKDAPKEETEIVAYRAYRLGSRGSGQIVTDSYKAVDFDEIYEDRGKPWKDVNSTAVSLLFWRCVFTTTASIRVEGLKKGESVELNYYVVNWRGESSEFSYNRPRVIQVQADDSGVLQFEHTNTGNIAGSNQRMRLQIKKNQPASTANVTYARVESTYTRY